jgi:hypothetical protein
MEEKRWTMSHLGEKMIDESWRRKDVMEEQRVMEGKR